MLPLAGRCVVEVDGERFELQGRDSVFTRVTDFAYVPRDAEVVLSTVDGCEVALPMARCTNRLTPEVRPGRRRAGRSPRRRQATRQVTNFGAPGVWDHADKLNACELITPDGNWSSYPPHKHDEAEPSARSSTRRSTTSGSPTGTVTPSRTGFGLHRTYTADGTIDEDVAVRDGDVFLIPRGYHGPCVAAPGYPMYYLNVLAGPARRAVDGLLRRPGAHLGPGHLGDAGARPALPGDDRGRTGRVKLTTAQALVRWLLAQRIGNCSTAREVPLFPGVFAIFGHGNVLGLGTALEEVRDRASGLARAQRAGHGARRGRLRARPPTAARSASPRRRSGPAR